MANSCFVEGLVRHNRYPKEMLSEGPQTNACRVYKESHDRVGLQLRADKGYSHMSLSKEQLQKVLRGLQLALDNFDA